MSGPFWALKPGRLHSIDPRSGRLPPRGSGPGLDFNSVLSIRILADSPWGR